MEPVEFKKLTDMIQDAVDELHKAVERQDAEIAKFGEPLAETKATIEKIQTDITALQTSKEELEVKIQRQTVPAPGTPGAPGEPSEEQKAHKDAFYKFVRQGVGALTPDERKALVEDATGQYLIEPELDADIVRELPKITVIRPLATIRTIGKDRIKMRSIGGVTVGWGKLETEEGTLVESTPTPGAPTFQYVEDLYGLAKIGEDELMDSDVKLEPILTEEFSRALGEEEDKQFVLGDGHTTFNEPEGITKNAILIAGTITTAAAAAVTVEEFLDMIYACPTQFRRKGVFIMNSATELAIRKLRAKDSASTYEGPFLWQPSIQEGKPNTFLGKPTHTQDDMETLAGTAQVIAIFGDFKAGYRIVDRVGMTIQRLVELYSAEGMVGFKIHKRVTGGVMRAAQKPLVLLTEKGV